MYNCGGYKMKITNFIRYILCLMALVCLCNFNIVVQASEESSEETVEEETKSNVVKILTVYTDENGNTYYAKQGTGFLVGVDGNQNSSKHVFTDYGILEGDNVVIETIKKRNGLPADSKLELKYYAIGSMGVMTSMSLKSYSQDTRYAVLETDMAMADKSYYKLGDGSKVTQNARIHITGYPGSRSLLDQGQVADRQMVEYDTIITELQTASYYGEEITYFHVGEHIEEGMAGAPIIDDEGCVSGMFILHNGEMKAISVKNIRIILDSLDINYLTSADDETYDVPDAKLKLELTELVRENKEYISSIKRISYTEKTWDALYNAIEKGEEVCSNIDSTKKQYEDSIIELEKARKKIKAKYEKLIVIAIILLVVVVLFSLLLAKGLKNRKRMKQERAAS